MLSKWMLAAGLLLALAVGADAQTLQHVYVGTYTVNPDTGRGGAGYGSEGIYKATFDPATRKLSAFTLAVKTVNPSYFIFTPDGRFAYAVNELSSFEGQANTGGVSAFAVDPKTGDLHLLNQRPTGGTAPCFISLDQSGKYLFVANYGTGSVAVFRRNPDGSLGKRAQLWQHEGHSVNPNRQAGPHAHFAIPSPDNRYLLSADLGMDEILVEHLDAATGHLTPATPPGVKLEPGTGPRHFAFADQGRRLYAVSEMGSTLFAFDYQDGKLTQFQSVSTKPADFQGRGNSGAEIALAPDGRFVYVSNRGSNTMAVFAVDQATGKVSLVQDISTEGKTPRMFQLDPSGRYLWAGNQDSANVVVYSRDAQNGKLTPTGINVKLSQPVCIQFLPER
jgi:6-phosphogluconolactonase